MKLAVVEVAARQFLVREGQVIDAPKLKEGSVGEEIVFPQVLLYRNGDAVEVGTPYLPGCSVKGKILEEAKADKIVIYKFKRRKNYHKKTGHRQDICRVQVTGISGGGE